MLVTHSMIEFDTVVLVAQNQRGGRVCNYISNPYQERGGGSFFKLNCKLYVRFWRPLCKSKMATHHCTFFSSSHFLKKLDICFINFLRWEIWFLSISGMGGSFAGWYLSLTKCGLGCLIFPTFQNFFAPQVFPGQC